MRTQLWRLSQMGRRKFTRYLCCLVGVTTITFCLYAHFHYFAYVSELVSDYYYAMPLEPSATAYRLLADNPAAPHLLDNMVGVEIVARQRQQQQQQQSKKLPMEQALGQSEFTADVLKLTASKDYYLLKSSQPWHPPAALPFGTGSMDFVIAGHSVVELLAGGENDRQQQPKQTMSPTKAIDEWLRVVRTGGYVYLVLPSRRRGLFNREQLHVSTISQLMTQLDEGEEEGKNEDLLLFNSSKASAHPANEFLLTCMYRGWEVYALLDNNYGHNNLNMPDSFTVTLRKK